MNHQLLAGRSSLPELDDTQFARWQNLLEERTGMCIICCMCSGIIALIVFVIFLWYNGYTPKDYVNMPMLARSKDSV